MRNSSSRWLKAAIMLSGAGALLGSGPCGGLQGVASYVNNFNPCGAILNCDPMIYRFLTSGYKGPGADPSVDMACTYPPYCDTPIIPAGSGTNY
jgi:hypothetical protein